MGNTMWVGIVLWLHNLVNLGSGDNSVLTGEFLPWIKDKFSARSFKHKLLQIEKI